MMEVDKGMHFLHPRLIALARASAADPRNLGWISYWLRHRRYAALDLQQPWITFLAMKWLEDRIHPRFSVLEYGSGGSTLFFASRCRHVVTVEHDPSWAAAMRSAIDSFGYRVDLRLVPPELNQSIPTIPSQRFPDPGADFSAYVSVASEFPDDSFDVISIDGRARCACIAACRSKLKPGGMLMLDNSERADYSIAADLLDGWTRHDFFGIGLVNIEPWCTTIWCRPSGDGT